MRPIEALTMTWQESRFMLSSGEPNVEQCMQRFNCAMEEYALRVCRPWAELLFKALTISSPNVRRAKHSRGLEGDSLITLFDCAGYDFDSWKFEDNQEFKDLATFCEKVYDFTHRELGEFKTT